MRSKPKLRTGKGGKFFPTYSHHSIEDQEMKEVLLRTILQL
jgi:hypothetical protein